MADIVNKFLPFYGIRSSYKAIFESPDGQKVLKHLMHVGHMDATTYVPGDPNETAHREGARRFILSILNQLRMNLSDIKNNLEEIADDEDTFVRDSTDIQF